MTTLPRLPRRHSRRRILGRHVRLWQDRWREPSLTALLVLMLLAIFAAAPLSASGIILPYGLETLIGLILVALVVLVSRSRGAIAIMIIALPLASSGTAMRALHPSIYTDWIAAAGVALALCALSWVVAGAVFGGGRITHHRVQGAVVLYLNFALIFSVLYHLMVDLMPGSFIGIARNGDEPHITSQMIYYSFTVLTTTGFGDIVPVHPFARSLTNLEAVIGQLYPATLLARLVTLELEQRRR